MTILRTQEAAQADRIRKAGFQPLRRKRGIRENARHRGGQRGGDFFALRVIQRGETAHLNGQAGRVAFAAVMQGFQLVLQRAVSIAGILARRRQRVRVNERVERSIRRIMREKAAAVGAKKRVARACVAEGEQKVVRLLRVQ